MKRFFRDAAVVGMFCGAFYLVIIFVSRLDGDSSDASGDFSADRKVADVSYEKKKWHDAVGRYQRLVDEDLYNSHAWSRLASCLLEVRHDAILDMSNTEITDSNRDEAIKSVEEIGAMSDRAVEVLLRLKEFPRYRPRALLQLAVVECYRDRENEALDYLEEFIGREYESRNGLDWYSQFGKGPEPTSTLDLPSGMEQSQLHRRPRFWALVKREREMARKF